MGILKDAYTSVIQSVGIILEDIDNALDEYKTVEYDMDSDVGFEAIAEDECYYKLLVAVKSHLSRLE